MDPGRCDVLDLGRVEVARADRGRRRSASTAPLSMIIRSGIPHSLPDGEVSGVLRSPCASNQMTPSRSCRAASPSTAPMCEQQQPPSTSGRAGRSDATASVCARACPPRRPRPRDSRAGAHADSIIGSPPSPHARGTRTSPARERAAARVALVLESDRDGGQRAARRALARGACSRERLLEDDVLRLDVHAHALVQMRRAGRALARRRRA